MLHLVDAADGVAVFSGYDESINSVAYQRLRGKCNQLPRQPPSNSYQVKVEYRIEDGEIVIEVVDVSFDGQRWSCFYDAHEGKIADCGDDRTGFVRYYLWGADDFDDMRKLIRSAVIEKPARRRLLKDGPDAFPKRKSE